LKIYQIASLNDGLSGGVKSKTFPKQPFQRNVGKAFVIWKIID
jgi:hypothetical protein